MNRSVQLTRTIPAGATLTTEEAATLSVINSRIRPHLRPVHQFAFSPTKLFPASWLPIPSVHIVIGTPWLEDLARYPSRTISISFTEGGCPTEQQLWEILRPYGQLLRLEINAKDSKATAVFHRLRSATAARNCLYGASVAGRKLAIDYIPPGHTHKIWEWLTSHPRIVLPVLAFFLGTFTYAVFDPIRGFFIKSHVENTFNLDDYRWFAWLRRNTVGLFNSDNQSQDISLDDWWERKAAVTEIQGWLREPPTTFITISGPRGSGKHPLLERALSDGGLKHLRIDCEEIAHASKNEEGALVPAVACQVGYFPVFGWISSLNSLIDLAAVGLIGSKAGFSTPTDAQLKQVLNVTTGALASIKADILRKKEKESKKTAKRNSNNGAVNDGKVSGVATPTPVLSANTGPVGDNATVAGDGLSSDAAVAPNDEATPSNDQRGYDAPVVVLDGFHHKGLHSDMLWNVLAAWAADITATGTAHVVFVTDNPVAMAKTLGRALPNVPFQSIVLADADEQKARGYVFSKLKELGRVEKKTAGTSRAKVDNPSGLSALLSRNSEAEKVDEASSSPDTSPSTLDDETAKWVDLLGGRLTDLEALIQKVSLGHSVETAVKDIIARTVIEVRKNAFGDDMEDAKSLPWTRGQAWLILEQLANKEELPYYSTLHGALKSDESAIKAMEQAELIYVKHSDARPSTIRAGRPVILQAIKSLCNDQVFADTQRLLSNTSSIASCEKEIRSAETEMRELGESVAVAGSVARSSQATRDRFEHLLRVLGSNQEKIQKLETANSFLTQNLAANGPRSFDSN